MAVIISHRIKKQEFMPALLQISFFLLQMDLMDMNSMEGIVAKYLVCPKDHSGDHLGLQKDVQTFDDKNEDNCFRIHHE